MLNLTRSSFSIEDLLDYLPGPDAISWRMDIAKEHHRAMIDHGVDPSFLRQILLSPHCGHFVCRCLVDYQYSGYGGEHRILKSIRLYPFDLPPSFSKDWDDPDIPFRAEGVPAILSILLPLYEKSLLKGDSLQGNPPSRSRI